MAHKRVTSHGSVNIPVAIRRELGIEPRDPVVVEEAGGRIVISPYRNRCVVCGGTEAEGWIRIRGKDICMACAAEAAGKAGRQ